MTYWRPEDEALLDAHEHAVENHNDNTYELARSKIHDLLASLRAENAALKARLATAASLLSRIDVNAEIESPWLAKDIIAFLAAKKGGAE